MKIAILGTKALPTFFPKHLRKSSKSFERAYPFEALKLPYSSANRQVNDNFPIFSKISNEKSNRFSERKLRQKSDLSIIFSKSLYLCNTNQNKNYYFNYHNYNII